MPVECGVGRVWQPVQSVLVASGWVNAQLTPGCVWQMLHATLRGASVLWLGVWHVWHSVVSGPCTSLVSAKGTDGEWHEAHSVP